MDDASDAAKKRAAPVTADDIASLFRARARLPEATEITFGSGEGVSDHVDSGTSGQPSTSGLSPPWSPAKTTTRRSALEAALTSKSGIELVLSPSPVANRSEQDGWIQVDHSKSKAEKKPPRRASFGWKKFGDLRSCRRRLDKLLKVPGGSKGKKRAGSGPKKPAKKPRVEHNTTIVEDPEYNPSDVIPQLHPDPEPEPEPEEEFPDESDGEVELVKTVDECLDPTDDLENALNSFFNDGSPTKTPKKDVDFGSDSDESISPTKYQVSAVLKKLKQKDSLTSKNGKREDDDDDCAMFDDSDSATSGVPSYDGEGLNLQGFSITPSKFEVMESESVSTTVSTLAAAGLEFRLASGTQSTVSDAARNEANRTPENAEMLCDFSIGTPTKLKSEQSGSPNFNRSASDTELHCDFSVESPVKKEKLTLPTKSKSVTFHESTNSSVRTQISREAQVMDSGCQTSIPGCVEIGPAWKQWERERRKLGISGPEFAKYLLSVYVGSFDAAAELESINREMRHHGKRKNRPVSPESQTPGSATPDAFLTPEKSSEEPPELSPQNHSPDPSWRPPASFKPAFKPMSIAGMLRGDEPLRGRGQSSGQGGKPGGEHSKRGRGRPPGLKVKSSDFNEQGVAFNLVRAKRHYSHRPLCQRGRIRRKLPKYPPSRIETKSSLWIQLVNLHLNGRTSVSVPNFKTELERRGMLHEAFRNEENRRSEVLPVSRGKKEPRPVEIIDVSNGGVVKQRSQVANFSGRRFRQQARPSYEEPDLESYIMDDVTDAYDVMSGPGFVKLEPVVKLENIVEEGVDDTPFWFYQDLDRSRTEEDYGSGRMSWTVEKTNKKEKETCYPPRVIGDSRLSRSVENTKASTKSRIAPKYKNLEKSYVHDRMLRWIHNLDYYVRKHEFRKLEDIYGRKNLKFIPADLDDIQAKEKNYCLTPLGAVYRSSYNRKIAPNSYRKTLEPIDGVLIRKRRGPATTKRGRGTARRGRLRRDQFSVVTSTGLLDDATTENRTGNETPDYTIETNSEYSESEPNDEENFVVTETEKNAEVFRHCFDDPNSTEVNSDSQSFGEGHAVKKPATTRKTLEEINELSSEVRKSPCSIPRDACEVPVPKEQFHSDINDNVRIADGSGGVEELEKEKIDQKRPPSPDLSRSVPNILKRKKKAKPVPGGTRKLRTRKREPEKSLKLEKSAAGVRIVDWQGLYSFVPSSDLWLVRETECSVFGCTNTLAKLRQWLSERVVDHVSDVSARACEVKPRESRHMRRSSQIIKYSSCSCQPPFHIVTFPGTEQERSIWLKILSKSNPDGTAWKPGNWDYVCSDHFLMSKETDDRLLWSKPLVLIDPNLDEIKLKAAGETGKAPSPPPAVTREHVDGDYDVVVLDKATPQSNWAKAEVAPAELPTPTPGLESKSSTNLNAEIVLLDDDKDGDDEVEILKAVPATSEVLVVGAFIPEISVSDSEDELVILHSEQVASSESESTAKTKGTLPEPSLTTKTKVQGLKSVIIPALVPSCGLENKIQGQLGRRWRLSAKHFDKYLLSSDSKCAVSRCTNSIPKLRTFLEQHSKYSHLAPVCDEVKRVCTRGESVWGADVGSAFAKRYYACECSPPFHIVGFPKDSSHLRIWIRSLDEERRSSNDDMPTDIYKDTFVCSDHFKSLSDSLDSNLDILFPQVWYSNVVKS